VNAFEAANHFQEPIQRQGRSRDAPEASATAADTYARAEPEIYVDEKGSMTPGKRLNLRRS
jgi:hypothetical protein